MRVPIRVLLPPLLAVLTLMVAGCAPGMTVQSPPTNTPSTPVFSQSSSESVNFSGEAGAADTFTLSAGTYVINQSAHYDAANDPSGSGKCVFAGELDNLTTGTSSALGSGTGPILPSAPLSKVVTGTFDSGTFKLDVYPGTTCAWDVTIVGGNA